jgi:N-acyl-phosphatidylethanolamine-hydrolysing phospholipase D
MKRVSDPGRPSHHRPGGGFRNPWLAGHRPARGGFWRWQRERWKNGRPPVPSPDELPRGRPEIAYPRAAPGELRLTWVGHSTFLIQLGGINILTDPVWSRRPSPVQFAGPARFTSPGVAWERLPPIDAVLLSHDHYDHLDSLTVRRLRSAFGDVPRWFTPLAYRAWFSRRRVRNVVEMDWWDEASLATPAGRFRVVSLPAQHWTYRGPGGRQRRLWCSWAIVAPDGRSLYFAGDTGYFPGFTEIRERLGRFDALLMPIGAYEPRWFMKPMHMSPEETARAYVDLGGAGTLFGMHWGTWRLTDEPPLEPPGRMRAAWERSCLMSERLQILRHGETWIG